MYATSSRGQCVVEVVSEAAPSIADHVGVPLTTELQETSAHAEDTEVSPGSVTGDRANLRLWVCFSTLSVSIGGFALNEIQSKTLGWFHHLFAKSTKEGLGGSGGFGGLIIIWNSFQLILPSPSLSAKSNIMSMSSWGTCNTLKLRQNTLVLRVWGDQI